MSTRAESIAVANSGGQLLRWPTREQRDLDVALGRVYKRARLLIARTARSDRSGRDELAAKFQRGEVLRYVCMVDKLPADSSVWEAAKLARQLADAVPEGALVHARLDELELELALIEALGDNKFVRTMAKRLYAIPESVRVPVGNSVRDFAEHVLSVTDPAPEESVVPAHAASGPSLGATCHVLARACGMSIAVRVEDNLSADAAVGERTVFITNKSFGVRQALRLASHEVLGHLVAQYNGRAQRGLLWSVGTAGSFGSQEGVCLLIEELMGVLDVNRLRTLAARTIASDCALQGTGFHETVRVLAHDHGISVVDAVVVSERAFRGGGLARDAVYLANWLDVRRAVHRGDVTLDVLQVGKVALRDAPMLRSLIAEGTLRASVYTPNRALSRFSTGAGTSFSTLPPSLATSLTNVDAT